MKSFPVDLLTYTKVITQVPVVVVLLGRPWVGK